MPTVLSSKSITAHAHEGDMSARTSDVLPACNQKVTNTIQRERKSSALLICPQLQTQAHWICLKTKCRETLRGVYSAFADDKDANGIAGQLVVAQQVLNEGKEITLDFLDDFIRRLRQVQLLPRPASNNIGCSEAILA